MPAKAAPTRIRLAARFRVGELFVCFLTRTWGDDTRALIRLASASPNGRDPLGGWVNGRWRDQSHLLTYWGPPKASTELLDALIQARDDEHLLSLRMQEVVEAYLLSQLDTDTAGEISSKLTEHLKKVSLSDFVDGESADAWSGDLGLASAQNLAAKLAAQIQLTAADHEVLRILLTQAPFQFGYWGPLKAVLKQLDPALMPQEFGMALARLSEPSRAISTSAEVEDLSWMEAFTDIPGERTEQYMARRLRRQLAKIGSSDPALYTSIAASLLQCWDSELGPYSYLPAYVMGGGQPVLNDTGRFVALPLLQPMRRDAHPDAWDRHRDLVRHLLPQLQVSVETFTFASQVLLAAGEPLPELQASQLLLALCSSDPRLVARGCAVLAEQPDQWPSLNADHWRIFLAHAEADPLSRVLEAKNDPQLAPLPTIVSAAADLLASMKSYPLLQATEQRRSQQVSEFYIAAITTHRRSLRFCADYRATVAALLSLGSSCRFAERSNLWTSRLKQIDSHELLDAYRQLVVQPTVPPDNLTALETMLLSAELHQYQLHQLVLQALEIPASRAMVLGWKLLDRCDNTEDPLNAIWQWLSNNEAPESFTPQAWQERRVDLLAELLSRSTDITAKVHELITGDTWQISSASMAGLMLHSPPCLQTIWQALAAEESSESAGLRTILEEQPALALAVGDVLQPDDLVVASPWQQQLLLRYVRARDRVGSDLSFAVAAVALGEPTLQRECLEQLIRHNALEYCWLRLAELGLPQPLATIRLYLNGLDDPAAFTAAVLGCIDSIVPAVRDLGLELIVSGGERIEHDRLWPALSQSDDPVVQARVAEETLHRSWPDGDGFAAFDRRLLVSRRTNRRAKELVQGRLSGEQLLAPERREALLDLARGANRRDREWALRRIAELALGGVPFDGVFVQSVTAADSTGGMN